MTKLKNWFISLWNRLLNKTTIDERIKDVVEDARELYETIEEVTGEVAGKVTKSKLRAMTKAQLIELAKKGHNVVLDSKLTKTNLINKVYELHNGSKTSGRTSAGSPKKTSGRTSAGSPKKTTKKTSGRTSAGSPTRK